jgi:acyl-CoA dehydrogenase
LIGAAQRALELMCRRADSRVAFGRKLSEQGSLREAIARSRCEIEQARLLTLAAAGKMDREGNVGAADLISMIKIVAPQMCQTVCDRAMQVHGGMGLSQDTPLPAMFTYGRYIRLADGPDEVHMAQLAKWTIAKAMQGGAGA